MLQLEFVERVSFCYHSYVHYYLAVECTLPARDLTRVVTNYESLNDAERARVPARAYWKTKACFTPDSHYREPGNRPPDRSQPPRVVPPPPGK